MRQATIIKPGQEERFIYGVRFYNSSTVLIRITATDEQTAWEIFLDTLLPEDMSPDDITIEQL